MFSLKESLLLVALVAQQLTLPSLFRFHQLLFSRPPFFFLHDCHRRLASFVVALAFVFDITARQHPPITHPNAHIWDGSFQSVLSTPTRRRKDKIRFHARRARYIQTAACPQMHSAVPAFQSNLYVYDLFCLFFFLSVPLIRPQFRFKVYSRYRTAICVRHLDKLVTRELKNEAIRIEVF